MMDSLSMSMLRNSGNGIHTIGAKSMIASPVGGGNNSRLAMRGQAVVSNSLSMYTKGKH